MENTKDYLKNKKPELFKKLQQHNLRGEVTETMEDYALDFSASLINTEDEILRMTVRQMRNMQKRYFATRSKKALIQSKELEKRVDYLLNK